MTESSVFISAGSNMGDREFHLRKALDLCMSTIGPVVLCSSVYETAAWGITDQNDFYNIVFCVQTGLNPESILKALLSAEREMGRVRDKKWGPRNIDLDILFFDDLVLSEPGLTIPHPQIENRRFILEPICEIAPDLLHPVSGHSMSELLVQCGDPLEVKNTGIRLISEG